MRPKLNWLLAAVLLAPQFAAAQHSVGPSLLPPPGGAAVDAFETAATPYQPPASFPSHGPDEQLPLPEGAVSAEVQSNLESNVVRVDESAAWNRPADWIGPEPWDTGIELGINGSAGTSESLSIRTGGYVKRESRFSKLNLKTSYNRTTESGKSTQNNAQFDARNDWLLDDNSPWTLYGTGEIFYDEFQAFDVQTSANTGIGYRFIHEPELDLIGRVGGGTSREVGGPDDRWVPESLFGFEYNQQLSAAQKFYGKLDYYPEWEEIGEFRLVADLGWQTQFAHPSNLSLKISASDRYDSTPNGANSHLVNYSILLLLKL
jgi:putative salt-induced outer membrane protein YdiY